jgi:hypothetical protein
MDANLSNPQSAPKVNDDRRGTSRSGGSPAGFERPDPMRDQMEVALDQADRLLNEARSRVNDLRSTSTNSDLAQAIARLGAELFSDGTAAFKFTTAGEDPEGELGPLS